MLEMFAVELTCESCVCGCCCCCCSSFTHSHLFLSLSPSLLIAHSLSLFLSSLPSGIIVNVVRSARHSAALLQALYSAGLSSSNHPIVSLFLSEADIDSLDPRLLRGHYFSSSYLPSIASNAASTAFEKAFADTLSASPSRVTPIMEAAYSAVLAYAQAVSDRGLF